MNETAQINSLIDFSIFSYCNDKAQGCPPQAANRHNRNKKDTFLTNTLPAMLPKQTTATHLYSQQLAVDDCYPNIFFPTP